MSALEALGSHVTAHAVPVLVGSTVCLVGGALAAWGCTRRAGEAQRWGEWGLGAAVLWAVVALIPLPRWGASGRTPVPAAATVASSPAEVSVAPAELALDAADTAASEAVALGWPPGFSPVVESRVLGHPLPDGSELPAQESRPRELGSRVVSGAHDPRTDVAAASPPRSQDPATPFGDAAQRDAAPTDAAKPGAATMGGSRRLPSAEDARSRVGGWLVAAWGLGVAALWVWTAVGWQRLRRRLKTSRPMTSRELGCDVAELPPLRVVSGISAPFCYGFWRPTIVVPDHLLQQPDVVRATLVHERAHIERGDVRRRWLMALLAPVLWWHPLTWWLKGRVLFLAEVEADRRAASANPTAYAKALLFLAENRTAGWIPAHAASALSRPSLLTRRFTMFLQPNAQVSLPRPWIGALRSSGVLVALTTGAALWGAPALEAQNPVVPLRTVGVATQDPSAQDPSAQDPSAQDPKVRVGRSAGAQSLAAEAEVQAELVRLHAELAAAREMLAETRRAAVAGVQHGKLVSVAAGDSFASLAREYLGSARRYAEIAKANPGVKGDPLSVGQELLIPLAAGAAGADPSAPFSVGLSRAAQRAEADTADVQSNGVQPAKGLSSGLSSQARAAEVELAPSAARVQGYGARGSSPAELLDLATRLADADGDFELAQLRHGILEKVPENYASLPDGYEQSLSESKIRLRTAQRKRDLVRRMLEGELIHASEALKLAREAEKRVVRIHKMGLVNRQEVAQHEGVTSRLRATVRLLESALSNR